MAHKNIATEELRREFIIDCAMKYFRSGELVAWLSARNYDDAATVIRAIDANDPEAASKVCAVFGVEPDKTPRGAIVEMTATITNLTGLHALTATKFAQKAATFKSKILINANGKSSDAKSVLNLMSMGIIYGTELKIVAEGEDAEHAVKELKALIDAGFGEEYYD